MKEKVKESGVILIFTLWILAALSLLALGFTHRVRLEINLSKYQAEEKKALYLANSGINRAILRFSKDNNKFDALSEDWRVDSYKWQDSEDEVATYTIVDEESKININKAPLEMLMALPGIDEEIASSVIDWRDEDDAPFPVGAEDSYYQTLDKPYKCKNAPFDLTEELLLIRGMTPLVFYGEDANHNGELDSNENDGSLSPPDDNMDGILQIGIRDLVTVNSYGRININTASQETLQAIPGLSIITVENIIMYRAGPDNIEGTDDDTPLENINDIQKVPGVTAYELYQIKDYGTVSSSKFAIISEAMLEKSKVRRTITAIVERGANSVKIVRWREN